MHPGERIREIREKKGISQKDFSKRLGYSNGYLAEIELGKKKPSRRFLEKLYEVFGISSDYILHGNNMYKDFYKGDLVFVTREQSPQYEKRLPENKSNRNTINKVIQVLDSKNSKVITALMANIEAFLLIVKGGD